MRFIFTFFTLLVLCFSAQAYESKEKLADAYQHYYNAKDCDAILGLFYTEGTAAEMLKVLKMQVCDFSYKIASIKFTEADKIFLKPIKVGKKVLKATLPPLGGIDFIYEERPENHGVTAGSFPFGQKDGTYYLVTSREVTK